MVACLDCWSWRRAMVVFSLNRFHLWMYYFNNRVVLRWCTDHRATFTSSLCSFIRGCRVIALNLKLMTNTFNSKALQNTGQAWQLLLTIFYLLVCIITGRTVSGSFASLRILERRKLFIDFNHMNHKIRRQSNNNRHVIPWKTRQG